MIIQHGELIQKIQEEFFPLFDEDKKPIIDGPIDIESYMASNLKIFFVVHDVKFVTQNPSFDIRENDLQSTILKHYQSFDEFTLKNIEYNYELYQGLKLTAELLREVYSSYSLNHLGVLFMNKIPQHEEHYTNKINNTYFEKYNHIIHEQLSLYLPQFIVCTADLIKNLCSDIEKLEPLTFENANNVSCFYDKSQNRYYLGLNRVSIKSFRMFREEVVRVIAETIGRKDFFNIPVKLGLS
jgi:hypothetical protein